MAIIINNVKKGGVDFSGVHITKDYFGLYGNFSHCNFSGIQVDDLPEIIRFDDDTILDHCNFSGVQFATEANPNLWLWEVLPISCKGTNFTGCTFNDGMNTKEKFIMAMGGGDYHAGLAFVSKETLWIDGTSILD